MAEADKSISNFQIVNKLCMAQSQFNRSFIILNGSSVHINGDAVIPLSAIDFMPKQLMNVELRFEDINRYKRDTFIRSDMMNSFECKLDTGFVVIKFKWVVWPLNNYVFYIVYVVEQFLSMQRITTVNNMVRKCSRNTDM